MKLAVLALVLTGQLAWGQEAIRLKNRTAFRPASEPRPARRLPGGSHYILQFRSFPGPEVRQELARRNIRVLNYVPDSGLLVSAAGPVGLEGLDVTWAGTLDAMDKISPLLSEAPAAAYLVIFHPDVDMDLARNLVMRNGLDIIPNPSLLPAQVLAAGPFAALSGLAAYDEVAYIMPASADLVAGNPVWGCAGPLTEAGPVGDYVEVGKGWSRDASGVAAVKYVFQSLTDKMDQNTVMSEIARAFAEWQKYANVSFSPGDEATAARTIAILFARGQHGDAYPFDGPGGVLAHTFYPAPPNSEPQAGDMHFDADESWHAGTNVDLFSVALHEAGHALGLGHSDQPGAVMYPYYRLSSGLTSDDIAGIQNLYGSRTTQAAPPSTPSTPAPTPTGPTTPATPTAPTTPPAQPPSKPVPDSTPPSLQILSPGGTIVSVSSASIHITGSASDNVGVAAVKYSTSSGDAGNASGASAWSADVPLLVGTTVVTIRAYDAAGNSAWRAITVVRH